MITIGKASELSGVVIETIRYYEREGIVSQPDRSASGRRIYTKVEVDNLRFIRRCRDMGLPVSQAKSLLTLTEQHEISCKSAKDIASHHLKEIKSKISELQRVESALKKLIAKCESEPDKCPILDELLSD